MKTLEKLKSQPLELIYLPFEARNFGVKLN